MKIIDGDTLILKHAYNSHLWNSKTGKNDLLVVNVTDIQAFPEIKITQQKPERTRAKWKHGSNGKWLCSACGTVCCYDDEGGTVPNRRGIRFCPSCGAEFDEYKPEIPVLDDGYLHCNR